MVRLMVNWLKNLVVNTAMRELAEDASVATGEAVDPLAIDVESKPVKKLGVKKK